MNYNCTLINLNGNKSISVLSSLIPIILLTIRLATLRNSTTVRREAEMPAQEAGGIMLMIHPELMPGDDVLGNLHAKYNLNNTDYTSLHLVHQ